MSQSEDAYFTEDFWKDALDVSVAKDEGVIKVVLETSASNDQPSRNCNVTVDYTGWNYKDHSLFDENKASSSNPGFAFEIGKGRVIKGWDEGVMSMKVGETAVFKIRPEYGYGKGGSPPKIPADSTLIFKVKLHSVKGEDLSPKGDNSIIRYITEDGERYMSPIEESVCTIDAVIHKLSDRSEVWSAKDLHFLVGEAQESKLPPGIDKAIVRMTKGEKSRIEFTGPFAYTSEDCPHEALKPGEPIYINVHLKDFEKPKNSWDMTFEEKLIKAEIAKEKGNLFFGQNKLSLALRRYKQIDALLQFEHNTDSDENAARRQQLLLSGHLNEAMVYLKQNDPHEALKQCDEALKLDADNVKALYRRGQALRAIKEFERALADFKKVLDLEAGNGAAKKQMQECQQLVEQERKREANLYSKMFSKPRGDAIYEATKEETAVDQPIID